MITTELENYILEDLRSREDLAMAWIYQEFANAQNYNVTSSMMTSQLDDKHGGAGGGGGMNSYDETLTRLLAGVLSRPDQREGLFSRLVLESPNITTNAIQILKNYCQDEVCVHCALRISAAAVLFRTLHFVRCISIRGSS